MAVTKEYAFSLPMDAEKIMDIAGQIEFVAGDKSRCILNITITQGEQPVDITGNDIQINIKKPDGQVVIQDSVNSPSTVEIVDAVNGLIKITLEDQSISAPGTNVADIVLINGTSRATTQEFEYYVRGNKDGQGALQSTSVISYLNQIIAAYEAATHDNTVVELADAKHDTITGQDFNDIGDRMDNHSSQLSEKAAQISSLQTQITSVASGSPKGVYATLSSLQSAFPTGNTNIYLVSETGNWYYWNGSAWTSGGTYQSTGLANDSVTNDKMASSLKKGIVGGLAEYESVYGTGQLPTNLNTNEGTVSPKYLPTTTETSSLTGIRLVVDNDSPMSGKLQYKRQIYRNTEAGASSYINQPYLPDLSSKPSKICFGFWIKDSDVNAIYDTTRLMECWIYQSGKYITFKFDVKTLITSESNTVIVTKSIPVAGLIDSFDAEAKCLNKSNGYSYVRVTLTNIVWNSSFTSNFTSVYWYHIFTAVKTQLVGAELNIANLTLLYNNDVTSGYYVYGDGADVPQQPSVNSLQKQINEVNSNLSILNITNKPIKIIKSGDYLYIRTTWNASYDLVQKIWLVPSSSYTQNKLVEFGDIGLIPISTSDVSVPTTSLIVLKLGSDDICPAKYNNSYIGANHGCSFGRNILATAHGKTVQDVGSEWLDGSNHKWYILRIVDANNLWLISENIATDDTWNFYGGISGTTLTHSANATNTSNINFTTVTTAQIYPAIKNEVRKVFLDDGKELISDGIYQCNSLKIINAYDVSSPLSILNFVKSSVGGSVQPAFDDASISDDVRMVITYSYYDNGSCVVNHSFKSYNKILLSYIGFIQSMANTIPSGGTLHQYIPKSNVVTVGSNNYNFKTIQDITNLTDSIELTKLAWEDANNPPERFVQYAKNNDGLTKYNNFGFTVGFNLEVGVGKPSSRKDLIDSAFYMTSTKKQYPKGISSGSTKYADNYIPANTNFDIVAFRCPVNYGFDADATNISWYRIGNDIYLMLDYHTNIDKMLALPIEMLNKKITIVEKTSSFTLDSDFVSYDGIKIKVTGVYGYAVLKLT